MHYYQRNIGDYGRDTGHLSALEHGVYTLLLDWYYLNERPITLKEAIRVSRGNPDETQVVLSEFFKETEQGWIHSYADRVIAEYRVKAARNRENGAKGGRPKASQVIDSSACKTQSVSSGMPERTLTNNQEPITKNQEPKEKNIVAKAPVTVKPDGVTESTWADFTQHRKNKKSPITATALAGISREAAKAGWSMEEALAECCLRGWVGFNAEWVARRGNPQGQQQTGNGRREL